MRFHFIGIGGVGMSALAHCLLDLGHEVQGSDATVSPSQAKLKEKGATLFSTQDGRHLEEGMIVVYSSAIGEENPERKKAQEKGLLALHRSELLFLLTSGKKGLCVTGSHGKTTTSALLAWVLLEAGKDPSFFLGGYFQGDEINGNVGQGGYLVMEADESDGSFLRTDPFGAIVTNLDKEHLDHWKSFEALSSGFQKFFSKIKAPHHLFWCGDDPALVHLNPPGYSYGFSPQCFFQITSYTPEKEGIRFSISGVSSYADLFIPLAGRHNALNASAVFLLALSLGIDETTIRKAFLSFPGTKRRAEKKGEKRGVLCYDDYAHHPSEIRVTIDAFKERFSDRRLVVLLEPHRFSRVKTHLDQFAKSCERADQIFLTEIYSAGETPIENISNQTLFSTMKEHLQDKLSFLPKEEIPQNLQSLLKAGDLLLGLGAGNLSSILANLFQSRPKVAVLFGGVSLEKEISRLSAKNILSALDPSLYEVIPFEIPDTGKWTHEMVFSLQAVDVAIPVFHGPQGEDGMIQGFLQTLQIPYVGCDYQSASSCMHKGWTKQIALGVGVESPFSLEIEKSLYLKDPKRFLDQIEKKVGYPVWIKPVHLGSSIGVSRALNRKELQEGIAKAFLLDTPLLAEKEVDGRQIEFAVLGNEEIEIAPPCEILSHGEFYDYEKKYGAHAMGVEIPAQIKPEELVEGRNLAEKVYRSLGCRGLARVDFFLDRKGKFWLNEVNPFPGFTQNSGYPKMWEAAGLTQRALMNRLILLALQKAGVR